MYFCVCNLSFESKDEFSKHFSKCNVVKPYLKSLGLNTQWVYRERLKNKILKEDFYAENAEKNIDYIVCPYCLSDFNRYKTLSGGHFSLHKKTLEEVKAEYPNILLSRKKALEIRKKTNKEKFGVEFTGQLEEVREKIRSRDTNFYEKRQKKIEETCMKKYGVKNPMLTEEGKKRVEDSLYKKYGVRNPMKIKGVPEKIKKTCIEKFGTPYPMQTEDLQKKAQETSRKNHGGQLHQKTAKCKKLNREAWAKKSGEEIQKIVESRIKTNYKRWGVSSPSKHPSIKEKKLRTIIQNHGSSICFSLKSSVKGYRPDLGQSFQSSWEANYARYLNYIGELYLYEPKSFELVIEEDIEGKTRINKKFFYKKGDKVSYTPDFYTKHYIEVKAILDDLSKLKISLFKKQYPKEILEVVSAENYKKIKKKYKQFLPFWENSYINIRSNPEFFGILRSDEILNIEERHSKYYDRLNEKEKEKFIEKLFAYYRFAGFPYPTYNEKLFKNTVSKIKKLRFPENHEVLASPINQELFHYFMPHFWQCNSKGKLPPLDFWEDDISLRNLIKSRLKYAKIVSDQSMRRGLKILCKTPTNFNAGIAKILIDKYAPEESVIYDFSAGFGGRLVGALCSKKTKKYIGIDVSDETLQGLNLLVAWLKETEDINTEVKIEKKDSSKYIPKESVDLIITSPPYFDKEVYLDDDAQSIKQYPEYNIWFKEYLLKSVSNAVSKLRKGGHLIIALSNIKDFEIFDDFKRSYTEIKLYEKIDILYPQIYQKNFTEQILIYKKN